MRKFTHSTIVEFLTRAAAIIIGVVGTLKLAEALTVVDPYFTEPDPVLTAFSHRQMILIAAGVEIAIAMIVFNCSSKVKRGFILLWFVAVLVLYKIGLLVTHFIMPCSCLGLLGKVLNLKNHQIEIATWALLLFFGFVGTYAIWSSKYQKRSEVALAADNALEAVSD